jgi:hypothetical protein
MLISPDPWKKSPLQKPRSPLLRSQRGQSAYLTRQLYRVIPPRVDFALPLSVLITVPGSQSPIVEAHLPVKHSLPGGESYLTRQLFSAPPQLRMAKSSRNKLCATASLVPAFLFVGGASVAHEPPEVALCAHQPPIVAMSLPRLRQATDRTSRRPLISEDGLPVAQHPG